MSLYENPPSSGSSRHPSSTGSSRAHSPNPKAEFTLVTPHWDLNVVGAPIRPVRGAACTPNRQGDVSLISCGSDGL